MINNSIAVRQSVKVKIQKINRLMSINRLPMKFLGRSTLSWYYWSIFWCHAATVPSMAAFRPVKPNFHWRHFVGWNQFFNNFIFSFGKWEFKFNIAANIDDDLNGVSLCTRALVWALQFSILAQRAAASIYHWLSFCFRINLYKSRKFDVDEPCANLQRSALNHKLASADLNTLRSIDERHAISHLCCY